MPARSGRWCPPSPAEYIIFVPTKMLSWAAASILWFLAATRWMC